MRKKIIGIFVCTLLIATALPGITTGINVKNRKDVQSSEIKIEIENPYDTYLQPPEVEWHKTYGSSDWDYLYCAHETDDGGYIACGATTPSGIYYPWVLKVDSDGIEEWNWTTTTAYYDAILLNITESQVPYVQQTDDGGYIACLWIWVKYNNVDYIIGGLVKLDAAGSEEWIKIYGEGFETSVIPTSFLEISDGFLVVGSEGPDLDEYYPALIMKTDKTGIEQWKKIYDFSDYSEELWSILSIDDGYICTGSSEVIGNVEQAVFLMVKTDKNGNKIWHKTYNGSEILEWSWNRRCFQTSDGGYIMAGSTRSFGASVGSGDDLWIVKTDAEGNMEWNETFGGDKWDVCWSRFILP